MGTHLLRRAAAAAAVCTCLSLTTACQNSEDEPKPLPPVETSTSTTPSESPSTSPSPTQPPDWQAKYTKKELAAYEAALDRYATYEQRSEAIWAKGKATPAAKALFQEYFPSPVWETVYSRLEGYEQVDVNVNGVPRVLWTKAPRISVQGDTGSVTLLQCVDYTSVRTTQFGEPVKRAKPFRIPVQRTVMVERPKGSPWLIYAEIRPTIKDFKRCEEEDL